VGTLEKSERQQVDRDLYSPTFRRKSSRISIGSRSGCSASAPSYYVEGLLYNVPNDQFSGNLQDITLNVLQWLKKTTTKERTDFVCANEQYYLLRDNLPTCWATADGENFINSATELWDGWYE
jgi:hypothetical protein